MSRRTKQITVFILVVIICAFVFRSGFKRSLPGRVSRFIQGENGSEQVINDLAEEIRNTPSLSQLQSWGLETLRRYREGQVQTNGTPSFWFDERCAVKLARNERPEFITHLWGVIDEFGQEDPEILVVLGADKQPEVVAIAWYSHGIEIGLPEYRMPYESWYAGLYVQAKSGIYVYHNYK